jgi:biopolymer transport protein ExbD
MMKVRLGLTSFALGVVAVLASAALGQQAMVMMDIQPGGIVILDHEKTSVQTDLERRFNEIARRVPRPVLLLKVSPTVRYDEAARVLSMAQRADLEIDMEEVLKAAKH